MALWKSFQASWRLARQLAAGDWLVLAEAWGSLLFFDLASRRASFERLQTLACPQLSGRQDADDGFDSAHRLAWLLGIAARLHSITMTCLVRSLALCWMLRKRGFPAQVRLGADKSATGFQAHAWVEVDGQPIGEEQASARRFIPLQPI